MIHCTIDGLTALPDTKSKLKITYENQYLKDSGEYTYQINFPMSVLENRRIFGNINRIDVSKGTLTFDSCQLFVDNRLLISGKGTVIGVTQDTVKLQIVGGKSRIKYNSKFEQHYIDEIDYPTVDVHTLTRTFIHGIRSLKIDGLMEMSLANSEVVGVKGKWAFNPVFDETNETVANRIFYRSGKTYMSSLAVQPYLFYVLRCVLEYEGFTLGRNDFDVDPWNRLVICSARQTTEIKKALPHWTVYTFLDEVRKLFNGSLLFNERTKTVDLVSSSELTGNTKMVRECLDEFSVEYDEDGLQNLAISNVEYVLAESAYRDFCEVIPQEVVGNFNEISVQHWYDLPDMTVKEKKTHIFKREDFGYEIVVTDEDPDPGPFPTYFTLAMTFNPLVRVQDSDDYEQLHISPVAMTKQYNWNTEDDTQRILKLLDHENYLLFLPSIVNDKDTSMDELTLDDDTDEYYISVQDAIENTDLIKKQEEDKDEVMQVMFQGLRTYNYETHMVEDPQTAGSSEAWYRRFPITFTDARRICYFMPYGVSSSGTKYTDAASLALIEFPCIDCIGQFASNIDVEKHNVVCLKFVTEDMPDPTAVYVFRNKKFLCQKIEIEVTESGVDPVKTGYFYELKS